MDEEAKENKELSKHCNNGGHLLIILKPSHYYCLCYRRILRIKL